MRWEVIRIQPLLWWSHQQPGESGRSRRRRTKAMLWSVLCPGLGRVRRCGSACGSRAGLQMAPHPMTGESGHPPQCWSRRGKAGSLLLVPQPRSSLALLLSAAAYCAAPGHVPAVCRVCSLGVTENRLKDSTVIGQSQRGFTRGRSYLTHLICS